jgi:hypothetical protein
MRCSTRFLGPRYLLLGKSMITVYLPEKHKYGPRYLSVYPASMTTTICMFEIRVKVVAVTQQDARPETCPASFKKLSFPFEKRRGRPTSLYRKRSI